MNLSSCFERCSALSFRQDRGDVALPEVTESSVLLTCRGEQHAWNQEDHQHDGNHASLCCCPLAAPGAEAGGRTAQLHSVREDPSSDCNPHAPPPTDTHTHLHTCTAAIVPMQRDASGEAVTTVRFENLTFPDITTPITIRHFLSVLGEALSSPVSDGS